MNPNTELFLAEVDPHSFFEKEAAISKVPDDDRKWAAHILSELYKHLSFLSDYDVDVTLQRVEPEAGFAFGHAQVTNKNDPSAAIPTINPSNHIRIPLIVADRQLQPFHTFELAGEIYPLSPSRVAAALLNPAMFDGPVSPPKKSKSLVDQLYPPYEQRQGFGRVVGGVAGQGMSKLSSVKDLTPNELETLADLKRNEKSDAYQRSLTSPEKLREGLRQSVVPTAAGAALGAAKAAIKTPGSVGARILAAQGGAIAGGTMGAGISAVNQGALAMARRKREKKRASGVYKNASGKLLAGGALSVVGMGATHAMGKSKGKKEGRKEGLRTGYVVGGRRGYITGIRAERARNKANEQAKRIERLEGEIGKKASVTLSFDPGRRIPANMIVRSTKIPLAPGVIPTSLQFFPVPGTKFIVGVNKECAKQLAKEKDQQKIRQIIAPKMKKEVEAARGNRPSPGMFVLLSKTKQGYKYHKPSLRGMM